MLQFVPVIVILLMMVYAYIHGRLRFDMRARLIFSAVGGLIGGALIILMIDKEWSGFTVLGPFMLSSLAIWMAGGMGMKGHRES
ncbi:hypothetical protein ABLE91_07935 [Aquabacter sp. CN5-332]|uniref:hypothetical protein n=1 Tax=Aquabacter sp. CN5-332 TaxID=3156608 RepID=UPI0032B4BC4C